MTDQPVADDLGAARQRPAIRDRAGVCGRRRSLSAYHEIVQARGAGEGRVDAPRSVLACAFCGRTQHELSKLIVGPGVYICEACVQMAGAVVSSGTAADTRRGTMNPMPEQDQHVRCSFCGKSRDQVTRMAAIMAAKSGSTDSAPAAICTECLSRCQAAGGTSAP